LANCAFRTEVNCNRHVGQLQPSGRSTATVRSVNCSIRTEVNCNRQVTQYSASGGHKENERKEGHKKSLHLELLKRGWEGTFVGSVSVSRQKTESI
jgi:hypothetical protein